MNTCVLCHSDAQIMQCTNCQRSICKKCREILEPEAYLFHPKPPKSFRGKIFCYPCFDAEIRPELEQYETLVERALDLPKHKKGQKNLLKIRKREQIAETVKEFREEGQAILQLQVLAVYRNFDAVCDLETSFKKVRKHGYEHKEWSAKGHFCLLKLENHKRIAQE
jgi:hypothetical protein